MNIIDAIFHLVNQPITDLKATYQAKNRTNQAGVALEEYMKDLFANSFGLSETERMKKHSEVFSYLGNDSNPPDAMLKNGDAIEVKKIESKNSALALNSSYPKHKLFANSSMISTACRNAEHWEEKDIIYMVGVVKEMSLQHLCMVYGLDYCASDEFYREINDNLDTKLSQIGIENFSLSCYSIKNPFQIFSDIYQPNENAKFNFMALINDDKWASLSNSETLHSIKNLKIDNILLNKPFYSKQTKSAKLITFSR